MEYTSASTRRKRCDSAESQENPKKFAASSDCSYSPPPAAKPFKINRKFGNSQVDGIDDDDLSVSGSEVLGVCSPLVVDRSVFSVGGGDEGDGHLDDHDLLSSASCETVQGDISGCCGVAEVSSPSSASLAGSDVSIQSGYEWPSIGKGCANCHNFLEKRFQESPDERKAWFFFHPEDGIPCTPPALYGHTLGDCPFLDLSGPCRHCKTPGRFLNSGRHYYSMQEEECSCCDECHYSQFLSASYPSGDAVMLMAVAEMASDPHITPTDDEFEIVQIRLLDLCRQDPDSD